MNSNNRLSVKKIEAPKQKKAPVKKAKEAKDPNKPKRPASAFFVFMEFDITGDEFSYKEWTSRKPYKERKKAIKEREKGSMQLDQDPELIYYGQH
ncbi:putative High mobility group box domain superfamily [Helianthus annuus]|uniref:High mobility group box domain superfamily n=1 Tax=Helianthus annuus TaxID=4232 RepID=A0A9K3I6J9_HELAN|nr:putative High mobility group box domain superfamily [Helianthus annuus]KAJ0526499.1 putative High mobility group protein HMGB, plant [Helianthus annuus]KAJ0534949.1 putative High mobility group box domain superfamily [Helianthus annuus]KAJ0542893.1 putative High mobility group protein HMGB, plant [Helianthus annuus]KAJ0707949.1 putative High mobility group protein HMGB, plant [Helianthus annuus]